MTGILKKRVLTTRLDNADGAFGPKRLAVLVAIIAVVGALVIVVGQRLLAEKDTWRATVTGVGTATVNFTIDEGSGDSDLASYPRGMAIKEGDIVLIRTTEEEGNVVVKVLEHR